MNNQGTTSNNNEITEEDRVTLFVAFNGEWEYDNKEWFFKNSRSSIIIVPKHISLREITDKLNEQFNVDTMFCRLKFEVHYRTGSPWFPVTEILNDHDLSVFISETSKSKLPLCVTLLVDDEIRSNDDEISSDDDDDEISSDDDEERWKDNKVEKRLIDAIKEGDWVKAREIIDIEEVTWTSKLNDDGYTALHYAVGRYKDNEVAREILMGINSEELLTIVDKERSTLAHHAALFDNTEALKLMLDSKPECLFNYDDNGYLVIHYALATRGIKTFRYLFEKMKSYKDKYDSFFGGFRGPNLLHQVIDTGLIDVAYELINDYPSLATTVYNDRTAIDCIIRKPELFYSGTSYGFYLRFVYHNVPTEDYSFSSTDTADVENQETPKKDKFVTKYTRRCLHDDVPTEDYSFGTTDTADVENQETPNKDNFVTKYTWRCLHDVISRICVKLWETTLLKVPHIKHVKDDKVKHNTTIKLLKRICEEATSSDIERLYSSPFCLAVENNTAEAIDVLTTYFPKLYDCKKDGQNIYQLNVLNRSEKVYSYILRHGFYAKVVFSTYEDSDGNNILHLAGRLAPVHKLNVASGAALQMQRELQWFKEVQKVVPLAHTQALNNDKETPMMVFRKAHKALRKDGEEWMKKTAESYTITAALIITIVFAAAITVPGGNDSATGKPIYETKASLILFAISDAISLFTSTTSLLLFLSILTARYADEDFLHTLPKRLIFGLVMLFVSVTSMMIAFSAALYIMFGQGKAWILIPIVALACLPIASFVKLQFPLLVELISSTYVHGIFGNEKGYWQSSVDGNKKKTV